MLASCAAAALTLISLFVPSLAADASYINGQLFTQALAIIDSPQPNSPGHAGSNLNIAVDISGDGQLPLAASTDSGRATSFSALNIFLVSSQTSLNMTVVSNSSFLAGEASSTVKHLNWPIPQCIPPGNYNLTFYETSSFNSQAVFAITPLLVQIQNANPSGQCAESNLNPLLPQPQADNPLPQSPFIPDARTTLTLTLSDGILNLPTVTVTAQGTPTTVVLISKTTVTQQGTTFTEVATLTTVVTMPTNVNAAHDSDSGFLPVNAGSRLYPPMLGLCCSLLLLYWRI